MDYNLVENAVVEWGNSNFGDYDIDLIEGLMGSDDSGNIIGDFKEDFPDFADEDNDILLKAFAIAAEQWFDNLPYQFDEEEVEDWYWNHCTKSDYDSMRDFYREQEEIANGDCDCVLDLVMDDLEIPEEYTDKVIEVLQREAKYNLDTCD
jgi:hypothetical protein